MDVKKLLNPANFPEGRPCQGPGNTKRLHHKRPQPIENSNDRALVEVQKAIGKDTLPFVKASTKGDVKHEPKLTDLASTTKEQMKFAMYPRGLHEIREYPTQVSYNKTEMRAKLGKETLQVFHYLFKIPGKSKVHEVMWDYNIGLVRITPLFKSLEYSKTKPGQVLKENIGLKDISFSFTGGRISAQGYWIPFRAARALATTFCYEIRYALTPLFGNDFVTDCIHPHDPIYQKMVIDPTVIEQCGIMMNKFKSAKTERAGHDKALRRSSRTSGPRINNLELSNTSETHDVAARHLATKVAPGANHTQVHRASGRPLVARPDLHNLEGFYQTGTGADDWCYVVNPRKRRFSDIERVDDPEQQTPSDSHKFLKRLVRGNIPEVNAAEEAVTAQLLLTLSVHPVEFGATNGGI